MMRMCPSSSSLPPPRTLHRLISSSWLLLLVFLMLKASYCCASATTTGDTVGLLEIYVNSMNGNDAWNGTIHAPVRTIQRAVDLSLVHQGKDHSPPPRIVSVFGTSSSSSEHGMSSDNDEKIWLERSTVDEVSSVANDHDVEGKVREEMNMAVERETVIYLSPGIHYLESEVFVNQAKRLTITSQVVTQKNAPFVQDDELARVVAFSVIGQVFMIHNSTNITLKYLVLSGATVWNLQETRPELEIPCGGAIMISRSSNINVDHVQMIENMAATGGAMCVYYSHNVSVTRCDVRKNRAVLRDSVVHDEYNKLVVNAVSNFQVRRSDFFGNVPSYKAADDSEPYGKGAGIAVLFSSNVYVNESVFANNTAIYQGGVLYSVESMVKISRSKLLGNVAFQQSSAVYSDILSEIYIDDVYFVNNYCIHEQCRLLYSSKKEMISNESIYRIYVLPILCTIGAVLCALLLIVIPLLNLLRYTISYIQYRRKNKQKDIAQKADRLIRSDRVVLWVLESFAIYYQDGTSNIWIAIHRSLMLLMFAISLSYAAIMYTSSFPLYDDQFDRIEYVLHVLQHMFYYLIPLSAFISMIFCVKWAALKLFSSNYSKDFENKFDKESEKELLLSQLDVNINVGEEDDTLFHTNSRKLYNRKAMMAVLFSFIYANVAYCFIVMDVTSDIKAELALMKATHATSLGYYGWISSIYKLLHWYMSFVLISLMLCVLYLICNRMIALMQMFFDEFHFKLGHGTFTLHWGIEGYVKLTQELSVLVKQSWAVSLSYLVLFTIMLAIETMITLWGMQENWYFAFFSITMLIALMIVTNVSYHSNNFVTGNYDQFVIDALNSESNTIVKDKDHTNSNTNKKILSNRDRMIRELTHFHLYIRGRQFSYKFPLDAEIQVKTVLTIIGLMGTGYAFLKYLSAKIPGHFYYEY